MVSSLPVSVEPQKKRGNDPISWYLSNIGRVPLLTAAQELASRDKISTESFAKYVLTHSYAASQCSIGSNASKIGEELAKIVRQIKMRQMF